MTDFRTELLELDSSNEEWLSLIPMMEKHFELMVRWNPVHNLTRDIQPARAALLHYRDSFLGMCTLRKILKREPTSIIDVGSGAGFPAIFLPHFFPDADVAWVEKVAKKASFLRSVQGAIGLKVEVLNQDVFITEKRDLITTRATFPWQKLKTLKVHARACVGFVATEPNESQWEKDVTRVGLLSKFQSYSMVEHERALACWEENVPRGTFF